MTPTHSNRFISFEASVPFKFLTCMVSGAGRRPQPTNSSVDLHMGWKDLKYKSGARPCRALQVISNIFKQLVWDRCDMVEFSTTNNFIPEAISWQLELFFGQFQCCDSPEVCSPRTFTTVRSGRLQQRPGQQGCPRVAHWELVYCELVDRRAAAAAATRLRPDWRVTSLQLD